MEEFRIIKDFENYSISNFGNVRNDKTDRILKQGKNKRGYCIICLMKDNKKSSKRVHRLVGLSFIPNPLNKSSIDHIDNNITNNNISNLRWASCQENSFNSKISIKNTSGTKGVNWYKKLNKWQVQIIINGKHKHLCYFENKEEAILVRSKKAIEIHGEFVNRCEIIKEKRAELDLELEELELEFLELIK